MTFASLNAYGTAHRLGTQQAYRRPAGAFSLLALTLLAGGLMHSCKGEAGSVGSARSVEAQRFVLVDKAGRPIAELAPTAGGLPALVLKDEQGRDRARLALRGADSPALSFHGPRGEEAASLALHDGSPVLTIHDRQGRRRAILTTNGEGAPSLALLDAEGKTRAVLGSVSIESPRTEEVETRPVSSLVLFNKFGEPVFQAPTERK